MKQKYVRIEFVYVHVCVCVHAGRCELARVYATVNLCLCANHISVKHGRPHRLCAQTPEAELLLGKF